MGGVRKGPGWAYRRDVALRVFAAVPLNYGVTTAFTMLLARLLPGGPAQAAIGATLLSFALFATLAILSFSVSSLPKLWLGLLGAGSLAAIADWLLIMSGGRL